MSPKVHYNSMRSWLWCPLQTRHVLVDNAGMRGIAHASMSSLDGVTTSQREREAAAKARASLDFSSLSDRAAKGARPPAFQRAQSADIPGKSKKHSQVMCRLGFILRAELLFCESQPHRCGKL